MLPTFLGVATLAGVVYLIHRLERLMATQNEQLTALRDDLTAVFGDIDEKLDQLNAQTDTFRPDAQATFDSLKQIVADKQAQIGDVDGSDTPAEPEQPTA